MAIAIRKISHPSHSGYTPIQPLGRGGFGTVTVVSHPTSTTLFAKKAISTTRYSNKKRLREALASEIAAIQKCQNHHHVISVLDAYESKGELGMILSPVADRRCLKDYLLSGKMGLEGRGVLERAFGCLAHGLAYMHLLGVRHGDVKPSNILIYQQNVVWSDFGLALDSNTPYDSTHTGPTYTTRLYSAPEVDAKTSSPFDIKADIFSLGCVFTRILFALENKPLQAGRSFAKNLASVKSQIRALKTCARRAFLVEIILNMLSREPKERMNALQIFSLVYTHEGFCCLMCLPEGYEFEEDSEDEDDSEEEQEEQHSVTEGNPWIWSEQYTRYYRVEYDVAGKMSYIWADAGQKE